MSELARIIREDRGEVSVGGRQGREMGHSEMLTVLPVPLLLNRYFFTRVE